MTVTLDPKLEERIQQEIDRGPYSEAADVIAYALDLLATQRGPAAADRKKALEDSFGAWAEMKEDGLAYQQRMRDEWDR